MSSFELLDIEFLGRVQEEHKDWLKKNFGKQKDWQPLLGILEEIGELSHSYLKYTQNVRMDENHIEKMKDAIGDIIIFMISFTNNLGIDITEIKDNQISFTLGENDQTHINLFKLAKIYSSLSEIYLSIYSRKERDILVLTYSNLMLLELIKFCSKFGWDINQCLDNAWQEVMQRNWTKERKKK